MKTQANKPGLLRAVIAILFTALLLSAFAACAPAAEPADSLPESGAASSTPIASSSDETGSGEARSLPQSSTADAGTETNPKYTETEIALGEKYYGELPEYGGSAASYGDVLPWDATIAADMAEDTKVSLVYLTLLEETERSEYWKTREPYMTFYKARIEKVLTGNFAQGQQIQVCHYGCVGDDGRIYGYAPGQELPTPGRNILCTVLESPRFPAEHGYLLRNINCYSDEVEGENVVVMETVHLLGSSRKASTIGEFLAEDDYRVLTVPSKQSESGFDEIVLAKPEAVEKAFVEIIEKAIKEEKK